MTALMLLMPSTPMLFQGQEFAASSPFLYFVDFEPELAAAVRNGRGEFLAQFPSIKEYEARARLDDPGSQATFDRCKLDFRERELNARAYALHIDLLKLRGEAAAFQSSTRRGLDGAVLSASAFLLRFFTEGHRDDRLLLVNLGGDLVKGSIAEPLIAGPPDADWHVAWSSEDPAYGGGGTPDLRPQSGWLIPGESALVFEPGPRHQASRPPKSRRTA
jgi:maltooligosyltrehalose trehalohydrolase